ncbi:MAG: hypothetical protein M1828_003291 [Chrysothrix sp. TS-e1954]|nr:MAG: hypothetical protein M1828_003291 [Chrysothrix sp. TS-e1954]
MMVVPFGFSIGDFIAGIGLVRDLIKALEENTGANADYRELVRELRNLKRALKAVNDLQVDDALRPQKVAAEHAALQCWNVIQTFVERNAKFTPTLSIQSTGSCPKWRQNLRKLQWAMNKTDEVRKLRAAIMAHTTAIQIILDTLQLHSSGLRAQQVECTMRRQGHQLTVLNETQELMRRNLGRLLEDVQGLKDSCSIISDTQSLVRHNIDLSSDNQTLLRTGHDLLLSSREISNSQHDVIMSEIKRVGSAFDTALSSEKLWTTPSPQVLFSAHAMLEDAFGRRFPIQTDFIGSWEAFQYVLVTQFEHMPGHLKVQRKEFSLSDLQTGRDLDVSKPLKAVFFPGSRRSMSMQFKLRSGDDISPQACPGCGIVIDEAVDDEGEILWSVSASALPIRASCDDAVADRVNAVRIHCVLFGLLILVLFSSSTIF